MGTGPDRVLIDTGEGKAEWTAALVRLSQSESFSIGHVVCTHYHHDHCGGCADVLASFPSAKLHKIPFPSQQQQQQQQHVHYEPLAHGDTLTTQGATLQVVATPGHTPDHLCLFLHEEQAIFTGDCILGQGTTVFANLREYIASLQKLLPFNAKVLYPGHGPVVPEGHAKVREYIDHRLAREKQIVDHLVACDAQTVPQIVAELYKAYPAHLHKPAEGSVLLHLTKLLEDGRVAHDQDSGTWSLLPLKAMS